MVNTTISDRVCGMGYGSPFMVMLIAGFVVFLGLLASFLLLGGSKSLVHLCAQSWNFPAAYNGSQNI